MKLVSLIKAVLSQDMNLFKYSFKNKSKFKKILLPIILFLLIGYSIGTYAYLLAKPLKEVNLTYVMLSMFMFLVTILTFTEGIYKSQGILFESKDDDLLFSLPIKKQTILFVRLLKILLFEYIYNLMFILPAFIIYIYFENPSINFYLLSILMTFLIPIIPTIISCFIGYIIKFVSSKSKSKKIVQTILTIIVFAFISLISFNTNNLIEKIVMNAKSINEVLTKIYYPIGAYITLIEKFDLIIFIKLILICILPLIIFIYTCKQFYFKIISNSKNMYSGKKIKVKNIKVKSQIHALTTKELKRYFSSPVYIFNTSFGLIIIFVLTLILCIKGKSYMMEFIPDANDKVTSMNIEMLYYVLLFFFLMLTSITSSSISLEGKTINITKTLPVDYKILFKAKIINCYIIEMPLTIISTLIYFIRYKISILYLLELIILIFISILLCAVIGLIINLKYTKLNASNDTEVVKQSMSSVISILISFGIFILSILGIFHFKDMLNFNTLILIHLFILLIISTILYYYLMKKGSLEYRKLNI